MSYFRFIEEIAMQVRDEIENAIDFGRRVVYYDYVTPCGEIHVEAGSNCNTIVDIFHEGEQSERNHNIIKAVKDAIPDWSDVERDIEEERNKSVFQHNGFSDARDYYSWKY